MLDYFWSHFFWLHINDGGSPENILYLDCLIAAFLIIPQLRTLISEPFFFNCIHSHHFELWDCFEIRAGFSTVYFATSLETKRKNLRWFFSSSMIIDYHFVSMLTSLPNQWRSYEILLIKIRLFARFPFVATIMTWRRRHRELLLYMKESGVPDGQEIPNFHPYYQLQTTKIFIMIDKYLLAQNRACTRRHS